MQLTLKKLLQHYPMKSSRKFKVDQIKDNQLKETQEHLLKKPNRKRKLAAVDIISHFNLKLFHILLSFLYTSVKNAINNRIVKE